MSKITKTKQPQDGDVPRMSEHIELYYDHYKDSFEQVKMNIVRREQYFAFAILFLFASAFTTFNPSYVQEVSNATGKSQLGIDLNLAFYTINSLLVFLSLWYIMRDVMFQTNQAKKGVSLVAPS